ncbi:MAG: putative signal transducing protein [Caldisericaceae bacterium]
MKNDRKFELFLKRLFLVALIVGLVGVAFEIVFQDNKHSFIPAIIIVASGLDFFIYIFLIYKKAHSRTSVMSNVNSANPYAGLSLFMSTGDAMEAEVVSQLLKSFGINSIMRREVGGSFGSGFNVLAKAYLGQSTIPGTVVNIFVNAKDFDRARKIIENRSDYKSGRQL